MKIDIEESEYNEIAALIHSDTSPVGIDAKKTHIYILKLLKDANDRIRHLEDKIEHIESKV